MHAKASTIKSVTGAWRPGTNNCAISTAPEKMTRAIASKKVIGQSESNSGHPPNCEMLDSMRQTGFRSEMRRND
jgi:hypothetical protein